MVFSLVTPGSGATKTLAHAAILDPLGGKRCGQNGAAGREAGFSKAHRLPMEVIEGLDFWPFGAYY